MRKASSKFAIVTLRLFAGIGEMLLTPIGGGIGGGIGGLFVRQILSRNIRPFIPAAIENERAYRTVIAAYR